MAILVIVALAVLGAAGDAFMKLASSPTTYRAIWLVLAVVTYVSTIPGWFLAIRHTPLTGVGALYSAVTIVLLTVIGVAAFHERLSVQELCGLALVFAAIGLLRRFL